MSFFCDFPYSKRARDNFGIVLLLAAKEIGSFFFLFLFILFLLYFCLSSFCFYFYASVVFIFALCKTFSFLKNTLTGPSGGLCKANALEIVVYFDYL